MSEWEKMFGLTEEENKKDKESKTLSSESSKDEQASKTKEDEKKEELGTAQGIKVTPKKVDKFDLSETKESESPQVGTVITIYGMKGEGKTTAAFSLPGTIACISFDNKSASIKHLMYNDDPRIKIYSGTRYLSASTPKDFLETNELSFRYLIDLLNSFASQKERFDWVVFDFSKTLQDICEYTMRVRNNLSPYQGVNPRYIWRERKLYLMQIHRLALSAVKRGIVYTTYVAKKEEIKDGEVIEGKDIPEWVGIIHDESDIVIRVWADQEGPIRNFRARVESAKKGISEDEYFVTGETAVINLPAGLNALLHRKNKKEVKN